jgi:hypothetical protein
MTAYGRGRSDLGKVHLIDPATAYKSKTLGIVLGSALCCLSSCVRMVKGDTPDSLRIVDCKRCLKIHAKKKGS